MTDETEQGAEAPAHHVAALAAVEAFGKMSPEKQRQFEGDLIAMAKADGLLPRASGTH